MGTRFLETCLSFRITAFAGGAAHQPWLVAGGVVVGLLGAFDGSRLLTTPLFGVEPGDPLTYCAVAAGLAAVALGSAWIPARLAAGVHPASALRNDA